MSATPLLLALLKVIPEPTPTSLAEWQEESGAAEFDAKEEQRQHCIMRQRCIFAMRQLSRADFVRHGADRVLEDVLDDKDPQLFMPRYEAARVLAETMQKNAPEKAALVLVEMLKDKRVRIYDGTRTNVTGAGEGSIGTTKVEAQLGKDARYLAALALGHMGSVARKKEVLDALKASEKEDEPELKGAAKQAREQIDQ